MKNQKGTLVDLKDLVVILLVLFYYFLLSIILTKFLSPLFNSMIYFVEHINDYLIIIFR
jgi:hypothetical protein